MHSYLGMSFCIHDQSEKFNKIIWLCSGLFGRQSCPISMISLADLPILKFVSHKREACNARFINEVLAVLQLGGVVRVGVISVY